MGESQKLRVVRSVCNLDCPDTCGVLSYVEGDRVVRIKGDPDHPFTRGFLCGKVDKYLERVYSPDRVLHPLRRTGKKGEGRFERITWDEALDSIAARLKDIVARHGGESVLPYSYAGNMGILGYGSMDRRFFHKLGASELLRTICSTTGKAAWQATYGALVGADPEAAANAKLIILWACNALSTNVHFWPFIEEARKKGATVIAIDPIRTRTVDRCDLHVQPRPGTDAALVLGMMHVLIRENLYDAAYVARNTVGFEALKARALEYPPEVAARLTGLEPEVIVDLARRYGTTHPSYIRVNYGLNRHTNGGMLIRSVACLPALVGAWAKGGGCLLTTGGAFEVNRDALERPDLLAGRRPRAINMIRLGEALLDAQRPVMALVVYNSNPAAVCPDQNRVLAGLAREDLFVVVHELFRTDTARYADYLLPATTFLEHTDLSYAYGHYYIQVNDRAMAPLGEAKSNVEFFSLLAQRVGFEEPCFLDTEEELIDQALATDSPYLRGITKVRLRREGIVRLNAPSAPFVPFGDGPLPTPSGKVELSSARLAEEGLDPVIAHVPLHESAEAAPDLAARYPIALLSPAAHNFISSSFANLPTHLRREGRPVIDLHPEDAEKRGIADGDLVRIFNDRGEAWLYARVSDRVRPGVAATYKCWWPGLSPRGANINRTVSIRETDMGRGPTFYTNLVEVERAG